MGQANLHNHSEGSVLDGQATVENIFRRASEIGHEFVTLTDHGEVNQHLNGFKAAKKHGVKFIPGMEGYWADFAKFNRLRDDKTRFSPSHICLLAMTKKGLENLWAISSKSYTEKHFYYKPISSPEMFKEHAEGIWASDGCMLTDFASAVIKDQEDEARAQLGTLLNIFGDRFYMELHTWQYMVEDHEAAAISDEHAQLHEDIYAKREAAREQIRLNRDMTKINQAKVRFATELGVPLVVVNDSHHAYPEHWVNKELIWALNTGKGDTDKLQGKVAAMAQKADHLMAEDELYPWMERHGIGPDIVSEAIKNSYAIAQHLEIEGVGQTLSMPAMAKSETEDLSNLIDACEKGFKQFVTDEGLEEARYYGRLEEELRLISDKKFAGYFNMVRDYTMAFRSGGWAQYVNKGVPKDPMLIGPGRGSIGGSLVAYLTGIDVIDPIEYGTLFSRFLSPGRKGYPDVDVDVPQSRRPDALKYFGARFGNENTCLIGTLSRSGPKMTVRDLGRALGISALPNGYTDLAAICEQIEEVERWQAQMKADDPDAPELTWPEVIEKKGGILSSYAKKYPELFKRIEEHVGSARNFSVHAAGVLVSDTPLMGAVPMRLTGDKRITTQFDMWEIEELGGVKLDLLGIRHLDTLSHARQLVYQRHGVWIDYDRTGLSVPEGCTNVLKFGKEQFRDPAIWGQIDKGHTTGIFQVETPNCTQAAVEFHPRSEKDVADLTSIIRPGVADAGLKDVYLRRRAGSEPVAYDHPLMEKLVGPSWATDTYGVLVYQEQLMEASVVLAGFTPDEADSLRGAVGKKQMDKLLLLKKKFLDGCQNLHQIDLKIANHIWSSIEASGRYAFNWSHAVGYAMISTWEIWTKHHYPQEFLVALMATDSDDINKYIREARRRKVSILPPDINTSERKFTIEGDSIRYGLDTVRGVGAVASRDILAGAPYKSLPDFLARSGKGKSLTAVYNLIRIGAFESIGSRNAMLDELERYRAMEDLAESTLVNPEKLAKTVDRRLNENPAKYKIKRPDFDDPKVLYSIEAELVGTYVTVDPMGRYLSVLDKMAIKDPFDMVAYTKGHRFVIGGEIAAITPTTTKKGKNPGQHMAHLTVMWEGAEFRVVAFPQAWAGCKLMLQVGAPVLCQVSKLDSGCSLETVERLDLLFDREGIA